MPQADLMTFHTLVILMGSLLLVLFSFIYYYLVPFWSALLKTDFKKLLIIFFIEKVCKIETIDNFVVLKKNNFLRWVNSTLSI